MWWEEENPGKNLGREHLPFTTSIFFKSHNENFHIFFRFPLVQNFLYPSYACHPFFCPLLPLLPSFQDQFIFHLFPPLLVKVLSSLNSHCSTDHAPGILDLITCIGFQVIYSFSLAFSTTAAHWNYLGSFKMLLPGSHLRYFIGFSCSLEIGVFLSSPRDLNVSQG